MQKSVRSLLKSSDIYLLDSPYSLGSYLVKERNQINLPLTHLDKSLLAAGQWKKTSFNHSWPKYSYWSTTGFFLTQHWQGCTAGTTGKDAILDAILSFFQIEGKGVKLFKEEPAVILPRRVRFHQRKIFPDSTKVLAEKATGKMNKGERHAGSVLSALSIFKRNMTLYYFRPAEMRQWETKN